MNVLKNISDVCLIPLSQGLYAIINESDLEKVSQYKYYAKRNTNTWYAERTEMRKNGKRHTVCLHEDIMGIREGLEIDHKNGNGLDCRRENLRHCTRRQNMQNCRPYKGRRFKGITLSKRGKKYRARISCNGKRIHLGHFETEIEAAQAYDMAAIEHFGTFARINEYSLQELENGRI
jgi:hypothetical protein